MPDDYAQEYRRYATMLRHVDSDAELVVCGHDDELEQNAAVGPRSAPQPRRSPVDPYVLDDGGPETDFSRPGILRSASEADSTEDFIIRTRRLIKEANPGQHRVGIALDEWGVWHPEARPWGDRGTAEARDPITYEQANTLRDALAVAVAFEGFHRQCDVLTLANIAQIVNVLQSVIMTDGPKMWLTPTYHIFQMHASHIGAEALPVEVSGGLTLPSGGAAVSATASRTSDGSSVTVTNRHLHERATVVIGSMAGATTATAEVLTADDPRAQNSLEDPERVAPRPLDVTQDGAGFRIELPPHSVATIRFN